MTSRSVIIDIAGRYRRSSRDVLISAVAAAIAWPVASRVAGDAHPIFAPIAAVIGLSPGIASRRWAC